MSYGPPSPVSRFPASAAAAVWATTVWPGLRVTLRLVAIPLSIFLGWPAAIAGFACLFTAANLSMAGHDWLATKQLVAAFACGSLVAAAYWPRRVLRRR